MKRIKRCLLHVGAEKTGSTSIQCFMGENRTELARLGFFIPSAMAPYAKYNNYNHIGLPTAFWNQEARNNDLLRLFSNAPELNEVTLKESLKVELAREVERVEEGTHTLLMSSEHVSSRLRSRTELAELKDYLATLCDECQVLVFLRPQHEVAISVASTAVKNGAVELRLLPVFDGANGFDQLLGVDRRYFDFACLLENLSQCFGMSNLMVMRHPKERAAKDVIDMFVEALGLQSRQFVRPRKENTSFDHAALLFMCLLNRLMSEAPESYGHLREKIIAFFQEKKNGDRALPAQQDAVCFYRQFERSNKEVKDVWFAGDNNLFDVDFDRFPVKVGNRQLDTDTAGLFFLDLLKAKWGSS